MWTAGTLEKHSSQKTIRPGIHLKCGTEIKMGIFITVIYFMAESGCQLRAEYSILPVWHTEWAFQRQTWEENVCSALCSSGHRGRHFIKLGAAATMAEQWKKWLRWQTKIDLALLCAFPTLHPSLFSISRAPPGWRKSRTATAARGRRDRGGRGGAKEGQQGMGSSGRLRRNRRALKAIYRPQGAGGGGAGSGNSAADTGITNNPSRHPFLLWSWAEGELLRLQRRHQPLIRGVRDVLIPIFTQPTQLEIYSLFPALQERGHCCSVNNTSCCFSIDWILFCTDKQTCYWMFTNTATLLNTPRAGALDQCTGNSFASLSPRGDPS